MSSRLRNPDAAPHLGERIGAARTRYERSWAAEIQARLKDLDFVNWMTMFGASLLWSALPLVILLSSLANEHVDADLSRHIGLNAHGARIVRTLFRSTPAHALEPIVTGLLFSLAGVVAVVSSLQLMYERIFGHEHRGWRNLPRWLVWTAMLLGILVLDGVAGEPLQDVAGGGFRDAVGLAVTTLFFWWTMHFLLVGRTPWRALARPAVVTSVLWFGLALFSSQYFSPVLISDSHTYGTIGVVFTVLTWFFLIGGVIVLGPVLGASWQARLDRVRTEDAAPRSAA